MEADAAARPIRVLVVDDDDRFAVAVPALLETEGFEVIGRARNGNEAIGMLIDVKPDVVTMDIEMPETDGVEAPRVIAASSFAVPIVLLTGSTDRGIAEGLAAGASAHVVKT